MKLIDKDAVVSWVTEKRDAALYRQHNLEKIGQESVLNEMIAFELNKIISFLNTLEVKEVDLEKAIDDYIYTHDGRKRLALELDWKQCDITFKDGKLINFAKHFFELGLKAQKGE